MQNTQELLNQIQRLKTQLKKPQRQFNWRNRAFDKQIAFISDPARLKASFTTRRGAKSYADGIYLLKESFETPRCNCLYLSLTRLSAKGIIWKDVLKDINEKDSLGCKFHETELTCTTPNGSIIYVAGVDVDENERKKLFGRKYKLVVIDEAALFGIDMYDLVNVVIRPALTDLKGTLVLSGMASNITIGLFYDITTGKAEGWSLHQWTAHDNPHVAKQWQEELDFIAKSQPEFMKTPRFKQAYLNKWVLDEDAKVYKYDESRNKTSGIHPNQLFTDPRYILGIDLGHSPDPSAFVVGCYSLENPSLYIIHAEKHLKMDITDVAAKIQSLERIWPFDVKVIDNANKQAVEELNNRHKTNVVAADKTGKSDFINLMNDEFIQRKIFLSPQADLLAKEYDALVWETDNGKVEIPRKEHPSLPNHLCDAALYAWRYCYQYLWSKPPPFKDMSKQEIWERQHIEKLQEEVRRKENPNELELDFEDDLFQFELDEKI